MKHLFVILLTCLLCVGCSNRKNDISDIETINFNNMKEENLSQLSKTIINNPILYEVPVVIGELL